MVDLKLFTRLGALVPAHDSKYFGTREKGTIFLDTYGNLPYICVERKDPCHTANESV